MKTSMKTTRFLQLLLPVIVGSLALATNVFAQSQPEQIGEFKEWTAYKTGEGQDQFCYIVSKPKDASLRECAADALKLTATDLERLGVIDEIIDEPIGGAHTDPDATGEALRESLVRNLAELRKVKPDKLIRRRAEKFGRIGAYSEA